MRRRLALFVVAGFAAGAVVAYGLRPREQAPASPGPAQETTGQALIGGPFSLVDHTGRRVSEKDFLGKPLLVYFGFTNCPDICPSGLQVISAALDKLGDKADRVSAIFVTLDPERDTTQKLAEYMKSFSPRVLALTGSPDEVQAVVKAYRVYARKAPDPANPANYSIDHSSFMYLMDAKGKFSRHLPHTTTPEVIAAAITKLL